jgi:hypothetical protein
MSYLYGNLLNDVFRKWDSKGWHDFCPTDPLTFVSVDICAISTLVPPVMDGRQTDRLYETGVSWQSQCLGMKVQYVRGFQLVRLVSSGTQYFKFVAILSLGGTNVLVALMLTFSKVAITSVAQKLKHLQK